MRFQVEIKVPLEDDEAGERHRGRNIGPGLHWKGAAQTKERLLVFLFLLFIFLFAVPHEAQEE